MSSSPFSSNAESLRHDILEFRSWRCHHDPVFNGHFVSVQRWQAGQLKQRHQHLLDDPRYTAVTQFFLTEMYGGLDLTELANEVERALPIATRLMPDSVLGTAATALQLNSLTGALDQRMAEILFEEMQVPEITEETYCAAYRIAAPRADRERQLDLITALGMGLDRYVRSGLIYATFRMAHKPAQYAGLSALYNFLDRGFVVMRPMGSAQDFIAAFVETEREVMDNIFAGRPNPSDVVPRRP